MVVLIGVSSCKKDSLNKSTYIVDHAFQLTDAEGKGLSDVEIELYYNSTVSGLVLFSTDRTDASGKVNYTQLDAGDYQVKVYMPNMAAQTMDFKVSANNSATTMRANTNIELTETLYMVGTATTGRDDLSLGTKLKVDPTNPLAFSFSGVLQKGDFYFISSLGEAQNAFHKGSSLTTNDLVYSATGEIAQKFSIDHQGIYTITVDLSTFLMTIEETPKNFAKLYVKGTAIPTSVTRGMVPDRDKDGVFHFNEVLEAGEVIISTRESDDENEPHFASGDENGNISNEEVHMVGNANSGVKWKITQSGAYKITFDMVTMEIKITPYNTIYTQMWIMGSALPNGFTVTNPHVATPVPDDPYSFYYEGYFNTDPTRTNPAEFKFLTKKGDWAGPYFMAVGPNGTDPMVDNRAMLDSPYGPRGDRKWKIRKAGNYRVTLNYLKETITMIELP